MWRLSIISRDKSEFDPLASVSVRPLKAPYTIFASIEACQAVELVATGTKVLHQNAITIPKAFARQKQSDVFVWRSGNIGGNSRH
jgi:hypothetical protein